MAKRVYVESVKKWAKRLGLSGVSLVGLIFMYLFAVGAISNVSYSGDVICAGTELDPCYAFINFTAEEDIFLYPSGYDPWGRNTTFDFDPNVKSWRLERSWGKGWREINMSSNCKGTWCGAPDNSGNTKYSIAFRDGRDYQLRLTAYKNSPMDDIKWGSFSGVDKIDPLWIGLEIEDVLLDRDYIWLIRETDSEIIKNDLTKTFNASNKRVRIYDSFGVKIEFSLLTPYENRVGVGQNTTIAEFLFIDWKDRKGVTDKIDSYEVDSDYQEVLKDYNWAYVTERDYIDCYDLFEFNNITETNETKTICRNIHEENLTEFNDLSELPHKNIKVALITDTYLGEHIEFIPTIEGFAIIELASYLVDGLILGYKLDESSGTLVIDVLGVNNGTKVAGTPNVDGLIDTAWEFDGSSGAIDIPESIADMSDMSVSFWVNMTSLSDSQTFWEFDNSDNPQVRVVMQSASGKFQALAYQGGYQVSILSNDVIPLGEWVHVVFAHKTNQADLYVNGVWNSGDNSTTVSGTTSNQHSIAYASPVGAQSMDGKMDEFYMYDFAMNGSQASDLYDKGIAGLSHPFEVADTCTYSSGNWEVDCNDNCTIVSNVDLSGNNLTFSNAGNFFIQANITNYNQLKLSAGCDIVFNSNTQLIR